METEFERFWQAYPRRAGSANKALARAKFEKVCRKVDPEVLIAGAKRYAEDNAKKVGTEFIAMASTWLNQRRWEDYETERKTPLSPERVESLLERHKRRLVETGWND